MRRIQPWQLALGLAVTVIGLSAGAVAQSPSAPAITPFVATLTASTFDDANEVYTVDPNGVGHARGATLVETYEFSDARLPPVKRMVLNFDQYPNAGTGMVWVLRSAVRMDDPLGHWIGNGQWLGPVDGSASTAGVYAGSQDVLIGHGAYEGLMAVMGCDGVTACTGYIVEGVMPPDPEPIPAPAG